MDKPDANLERLARKHREYDERLEVLAGIRFPTEEERLEESTLKKLKLKVKDEMESILRHKAEPPARHG
ncbi:MAG TPA: DUF465 domain-containing protein [Candidatus Polarisedimenticolaceae bacterium]|nr:DUF465 domain-containing protein [Candidatus Polarisedimenticolaceae bacterium]